MDKPVLLDDLVVKPFTYNMKFNKSYYKGGKNNLAIMLRELMDRDLVTTAQFLDAIYPTDGPEPPDNMNRVLRVNLCMLRKKLKDGWEIVSVSWHCYRLMYKKENVSI